MVWLKRIIDSNECVHELDKDVLTSPHLTCLVNLLRTVKKCNFNEYMLYNVMEGDHSRERAIGLVTEYKFGMRSEYHFVSYKEQFSSTVMDVMLAMVNWKNCNLIHSLPIHQIQFVIDEAKQKGTLIKSVARYNTVVLKTIENLPEVTYVEGATVAKLKSNEARIINSNWVNKCEYSEERIRRNLEIGVGYGVYADGQLVSWALLNHTARIGFVHTLPAARHRGYACMVVNRLARHLLEMGLTPIANVEVSNRPSMDLFCNKLGFEKVFESVSLTFCPENR